MIKEHYSKHFTITCDELIEILKEKWPGFSLVGPFGCEGKVTKAEIVEKPVVYDPSTSLHFWDLRLKIE